MELIVKPISIPDAIEFNFEPLKAWIEERTSQYQNLVYAEDQIGEAKKNVADLRRLQKALTDEKIRVKKEFMEPYTEFEERIKELNRILDVSIENIDGQIKVQDEKKKAEKRDFLEKWFETAEGKPEWLQFEQLFESRWLNTTVKVPAIQDEINTKIRLIRQDLLTLSTMSFGFEATEFYKTSLNLNSAIAEGQRLEAIQKAKEEAERKAKEEEEKAKEPIEEPKAEPVSVPQTEEKKKLYAVMLCVEPSRVESTMKALDEMGVKAKFMTYDKDNKVWRL